MKYFRITLYMLAAVLLLSASPMVMLADTEARGGRIPAPTDPAMLDPEIPPLTGGAPYPFPITRYQPAEAAAPTGPDATTAPVIAVWYGLNQNFGQPGTPQEWINVLGNVTGATSLSYTLNNGPEHELSIGPDGRRLQNAGDFNIELNYADLNDGANTILIKADDGSTQSTQTVTVNYDAGNEWPLPYTADWGAIANLQSGAQVVDGQWAISGDQLQITTPGYDRLLALGSMNWTDYEVEVPVTVNALGTSSQGSGVGLILRWLGHYDAGNGSQPVDGWRRLGTLVWYRWTPGGSAAFEMRGNGGQDIIPPNSDQAIELGVPYIFKVSVQSSPFSGNAATYRFKFWPVGQNEPPQWYLTATGNPDEPLAGSVALVAHHATVTWGDVSVRPIQGETFTIDVDPPQNGSIVVTPQKAVYDYGDRVEIRAQGLSGFVMSNWTGSFSGNQNPLEFDITQDINIGATFESGPAPKLNLTVAGQGEVTPAPKKNNYLYGELVTLTPQPALGYIFSGWSGDLSGADNPAVVAMSGTRNITANFIPANADSPVSDDFNACALNTALWTFVNPVGDGSYQVNGTQLLLNVPGNISHNIWDEGNRSVRVMQPTQNVNFEIVTKFESAVTQRYQMQGVLVEQDSQNFLRFEFHNDGSSVRLYVARFLNGLPKAVISDVLLPTTPPYLRITRAGGLWSVSYSEDGNTWVAGGSFNFAMTVTKSGIFGANHGTPPLRPAPAHTVIADYFFNTAAPIVPEDGNTLEDFTVTTQKVGQGTVTLNPSKPTYSCGETVTVTAVPAAGWTFGSWSGDLSGSSPAQQLVISRDHQVTATFVQQPTEFKIFLPIGIDR